MTYPALLLDNWRLLTATETLRPLQSLFLDLIEAACLRGGVVLALESWSQEDCEHEEQPPVHK
jgi:hypothetical protein